MALNWADLSPNPSRCGNGPRPGTLAFAAWLLDTYRWTYSLGIYNCRLISGSSNLSTHAVGRGFDQGMDPVNRRGDRRGHDLVKRVGQHGKRLGIQRAIFDRTIWDGQSVTGSDYYGENPHFDHIHWELTIKAADNLTLATLRSVLGGSRPTPPPSPPKTEEIDMSILGLKRGDGKKVSAASADRVEDLQRMIEDAAKVRNMRVLVGFGADGDYGGETARDFARVCGQSGEWGEVTPARARALRLRWDWYASSVNPARR